MIQVVRGHPANQRVQLRGVGHPTLHVLESGRVRLVVGNELYRRVGASAGDDALRQAHDGDLLGGADVVHLAFSPLVIDESHQGSDHVGHVAKAPRLGAVAVNGERFPGHCLAHQPRYHHSVCRTLARPYRVEQAHNHHGEVSLPVVREGQDLVH